MATYFVGQRVRIKWSLAWPELAGEEGQIVPVPSEMPLFINPRNRGWAVAPDCWGRPYPRPYVPGRGWFGPSPDQLEPILPSGHTAGTESFQELMDRLNTQRVEKVEEVGA